ncbi:glycosyl hydrolase family 18 protein, partial [Sedimentibacter sp.]
ASETIDSNVKFKVIGYYSGDLFNEHLENLQTDKLTHVIYAFLIPKADGGLVELQKPEQLRELISQAHEDDAKIFIALGGWSYEGKPLQPIFEQVAANDETRKLLIENVCSFVDEYNLDGVELDWEHPNKNTISDYEKLAVDLGNALKSKGKGMTAALNGAWSKTEGPEPSMVLSDKCLEVFDFINVMAYDINDTDHSPIWFTETSIEYWINRGVPAEEIVIGIPLYARPSWLQYRHLVAKNPEYAYSDYAPTEPLESYYNGMNTLREKTIIALSKAGGVMLFDVNEDTNDEYSIVTMIDNLVNRIAGMTKEEINRYVTVVLENKELVFLKEEGFGIPFINGYQRTMIPLRKPLESIGAAVSYDADKREVTAVKDNITVIVPIDQNYIYINGNKTETDTAAIIKEDRTYIPLRAVFEAFGYEIDWHNNSRTVFIIETVE